MLFRSDPPCVRVVDRPERHRGTLDVDQHLVAAVRDHDSGSDPTRTARGEVFDESPGRLVEPGERIEEQGRTRSEDGAQQLGGHGVTAFGDELRVERLDLWTVKNSKGKKMNYDKLLNYPEELTGATAGGLSIITCTQTNGKPTSVKNRLIVRAYLVGPYTPPS